MIGGLVYSLQKQNKVIVVAEITAMIKAYFPDTSKLEMVKICLSNNMLELVGFTKLIKDKVLTKAQASKFIEYNSSYTEVSCTEHILNCELFGFGDFDEKPFIKLITKLGAYGVIVERDCGGEEDFKKYTLIEGKKSTNINFLNSIINVDLDTALILAVEERDFNVIHSLLVKGVSANLIYRGESLLQKIFSSTGLGRNDLDIASTLLEFGADANFDSKVNGDSVLMTCIKNWDDRWKFRCEISEPVLLLVGKGADVNHANKEGVTAFMSAAKSGNIESCDILIKSGVNINAIDAKGRTAIFYAIDRHNCELSFLTYLLDKGLDVNHTDNNGNTILIHTWKEFKIEKYLLELGLKHEELIIEYKGDEQADFNTAIHYNQLLKIDELIKAGVDVNFLREDAYGTGKLLILYAISSGRFEVLKKLDQAGAEFLDILDGGSIMELAASSGQVDIMKLLLSKGFLFSVEGERGSKSISESIRHGMNECSLYMLENGAKPLLRSDHLKSAVSSASPAVIRKIVEGIGLGEQHGADLLELAIQRSDIAIIECILELGVDVNDGALACAMFQHKICKSSITLKVIDFLLKRKCNLDGVYKDEYTALIQTIQFFLDSEFTNLIDAGCNIDFVDPKGRSPISYAVGKRNEHAVKLLLSKGADLNIKDNRGFTVFSYLKRCKDQEILDLFDKLEVN